MKYNLRKDLNRKMTRILVAIESDDSMTSIKNVVKRQFGYLEEDIENGIKNGEFDNEQHETNYNR